MIRKKEYIVYSDRNLRWTFRYFNSRVDELAKGLMAIGVKQGTHVGIWAANIPDWTTMLMACSKLGAVTITVNTNFKQYEVEDLCLRSDMEVLCIGDHNKDNNLVQLTYQMLPELKTMPFGQMRSEKLPKMRQVIYFGAEPHRGMHTINEVMTMAMTTNDADYADARLKVDCHDLVNIQ